jgi:hypothetical protein
VLYFICRLDVSVHFIFVSFYLQYLSYFTVGETVGAKMSFIFAVRVFGGAFSSIP